MTERGIIGGGLAAFVLLCTVCVWQHVPAVKTAPAGSAVTPVPSPTVPAVVVPPISAPIATAGSTPAAVQTPKSSPTAASAAAGGATTSSLKPSAVLAPIAAASPPAAPPTPSASAAVAAPIAAAPALSGAKKVEQEIARQLSGKVVEFESVSDKLTPQGKAVLDGLLPLFAQDPSARFVIEGHTDSWGEKEFNQALSERRAQTVRAYLVSKGLEAQRFTARGYGDAKPIANNKTTAGSRKNRRIEFKAQ